MNTTIFWHWWCPGWWYWCSGRCWWCCCRCCCRCCCCRCLYVVAVVCMLFLYVSVACRLLLLRVGWVVVIVVTGVVAVAVACMLLLKLPFLLLLLLSVRFCKHVQFADSAWHWLSSVQIPPSFGVSQPHGTQSLWSELRVVLNYLMRELSNDNIHNLIATKSSNK